MRNQPGVHVLGRFGFGAILALAVFGCGTSTTVFPNRLIGADGQEIFLDDIAAIVGDSSLSDEEKRQGIRELGIEDEVLIEALLTL